MSTGVLVREAEPADVESVLAVDDVPGRADEVRRAVAESRCLVAAVGDQIVGFCLASRFYGFDLLELLVVTPERRRAGVGTTLVEAWERSAQTPKLFTSTNESNVPMQRLCERIGYVRSGFIDNLDEGDPEIIYFKPNGFPGERHA
jgi:RimJ/RimL family protein N-acetyltransferase